MGIMIEERSLACVSAVIGICGENFCSFVADTRRTLNRTHEMEFHDDKTSKIFKLNNNILYGMTGIYPREETVLTPVESVEDTASATPQMVVNAILGYLDTYRYTLHTSRNFLVGYKDSSGAFCIQEIHWNVDKREPELTLRKPTPPVSNFGISCMLPPKAAAQKDHYISMVEQAITTSREHKEMLGKVAGVIGKIAAVDETVGTNVQALTIT